MTTGADRVRARVLVAAASKHGSTSQIADHIARNLRNRGLEVDSADAANVHSVDGYDAMVLGSAVYAGHWMREARDVADLLAEADSPPRLWLFSSGPVGDPPKPDEDPVDVAAIAARTNPVEHRVFAGRIDRSLLGFGERAIAVALRAPEGDFRDWHAIAEWAETIARTIARSGVR